MLRSVLAAVMAALVCAGVASAKSYSARSLSDARVGHSKVELVAQKTFSGRIVSQLRRSWRVAPRHRTCWSHVPWARVCDHARRRLHAQRWLLSIADARLERLYPSIPHLALWRCIAGYPGARPGGGSGESGGAESASNGSHFNVLQMTMPWGKGSYLVSDPIHASAGDIVAAAERGYAANHYSQSWLWGQWGQTLSPCLRFA